MAGMFDPLRGKCVLVTGASGHLGARLVLSLVVLGAKVKVLVRSKSDLWRLVSVRDTITVIPGSIEEADSWMMSKELDGVRIVFHLAAAGVDPRYRQADLMTKVNVRGTWNILEASRVRGVERFIYCGSCFEYKEGTGIKETIFPMPVSDYGVTKALGWLLANGFYQQCGLPVVSVRLFTFYGPQELERRLVPYVILSILDGKSPEMSDGMQVRDFVYVDDVVDALLRAAVLKGIDGETINIASGQGYTVRELVQEVIDLMHTGVKPKYGMISRQAGDVSVLIGDPEKAARLLGWKNTLSLREGLMKTIQWWRANR